MNVPNSIHWPPDRQLGELREQLRSASSELVSREAWPARQLAQCAAAGVLRWFVPSELGGQGFSTPDICRGYFALSSACLTTTFVITQYMGACQRIAASGNEALIQRWLADMLTGAAYGTIGISHLTTSRRHLSTPVLRAQRTASGFCLNGYSPWVTGASQAQVLVVGATLDDGSQILAAVPTVQPGVYVADPQPLIALAASRTGPVEFHSVEVSHEDLLAGPEVDVMKRGKGGNTGGLQTSALALGLTAAALEFLDNEARRRADLQPPISALQTELDQLLADLLSLADGVPACSTEQLRARANSLVLRATQAALVAAKGAGFVEGHPAGRWCREALFFLVWSCPQNVLNSNLCELAGIAL